MSRITSSFSSRLLDWHQAHGRHNLPWQLPRSPYRVWVSEIMLQQTQVATVIPYFERFMQRFGDVATLAQASLDEVLQHWAGLGYYARGRNLHRAAIEMHTHHRSQIPSNFEDLIRLPGIGRSTAGAILAQAFDQRFAILDGNVRRVLARHAAEEGWPGKPLVQTRLWAQAEARLPNARYADYTQSLMDLGSLLCTARAPRCNECPVAEDCIARQQGLTAQLPTPKPRKARPLRHSWALIVQSEAGHVLVEKRPPAGIWGALWSLPLSIGDETPQSLAKRYVGDEQHLAYWPPVRHAFTHFELELGICICKLAADSNAQSARESADSQWLDLHKPELWPGMPAPLRKLLERARQASIQAATPSNLNTGKSTCPEPSNASSSAKKPKASSDRPIPAISANESLKMSRKKPGRAGSSIKRA